MKHLDYLVSTQVNEINSGKVDCHIVHFRKWCVLLMRHDKDLNGHQWLHNIGYWQPANICSEKEAEIYTAQKADMEFVRSSWGNILFWTTWDNAETCIYLICLSRNTRDNQILKFIHYNRTASRHTQKALFLCGAKYRWRSVHLSVVQAGFLRSCDHG
jgi:hypothetical protein